MQVANVSKDKFYRVWVKFGRVRRKTSPAVVEGVHLGGRG